MNTWIKVGAKCQCVKAFDAEPGSAEPKVGDVVTITDVDEPCPCGGITLRFAEVPGTIGDFEVYWCSSHFRPLVDQQQDVAKFEHLLTPTKRTVEAITDDDLEHCLEALAISWATREQP